MNETQWRRDHVLDLAARGGWKHYYHPYSLGATPGWPDVALVKPPVVILAELKGDGGQLRPAQRATRDLLERCERVEYRLWSPRDLADVAETLGVGRLL